MKQKTKNTIKKTTAIIIAIAMFTITLIGATATFPSTLLHFVCNEDYTSIGILSTGYTLTATAGGTAFNTSDKKLGSASCEFQGAGSGVAGLLNKTDMPVGNKNHTITWWQKLDAVGVAYNLGIGATTNGNQSSYQIQATTLGNVFGADDVTVNYATPINVWEYHTIVVHSNKTVQFYVNATLIGSATHSNTAHLSYGGTYSFCMGSRPGDCLDALKMNGRVDDVRVYNQSLTISQISALYNSGVGTEEEDIDTQVNTTLTITAKDEYNSTAINNFSINYTWANGTTGTWTTTNGTISEYEELRNSSTTINLTFWNIENYNTKTYADVPITANASNTKAGEITPIISDFHIKANATNLYTGTGINNFTVTVNGTNKTTTTGIVDTGILYNNTNAFNMTFYSTGYVTKQYNDYIANTSGNITAELVLQTNYYLTINIYNYLNTEILSQVSVYNNHTGTTTTENPYITDANNYINLTVTSRNINLTITDLEYKHVNKTYTINVTDNNLTQNITMTPNQIVLYFWENSTNTTATEGFIADQDKRYDFNDTEIAVVQQNLTMGYIQVRFNMVNGTNHTQFYEYINDYETNIDENIRLLQKADWYTYVQILDYANSPIKDAIVRTEYSYRQYVNNFTQYNPHELYGQRLTDDDGYTFFWGDTGSEVMFTVTKDGYTPVQLLITIGDESFEKANPITIYLKENNTRGSYNMAWVGVENTFNKTDTNIYGVITAIGKTTVKVQTDYRISQGLTSLKDITSTKDILERFTFNLTNGTDFTTGQNLTVMIYLDEVFWRNYTIAYEQDTQTRYFQEVSEYITERALNILLAIGILIVTISIGLLFKTTNAGVTAFTVSSIIASLIQIQFLWLTAVTVLGLLLRWIVRKVIEE